MHLCVHLKSENIFLFVIYFIHKYRDFKKEVLSDIVIKIGVQLFFFYSFRLSFRPSNRNDQAMIYFCHMALTHFRSRKTRP